MGKTKGKQSSRKKISASTIDGLLSKRKPDEYDLAIGNSSSENEDCSRTIDEELPTERRAVQYDLANGNSSSENEDITSITDEEFSPQQNPIQYSTANGNSSSENDDSSSTTDEECPSYQNPVQYNPVIGDSSSENEGSTADEENSRSEAARKREKTLGLRRCYPIIWAGDLFLGKLHAEIEIKFISGDPAVCRAALRPPEDIDPTIHIRMRLPFHGVPQAHTKRKMLAKKDSCVLIALPINNNQMQASRMEHQFIHYFRRKRVVGIAELPQDATAKPQYKMLIFPPSDFIHNILSKIAPTLAKYLYLETTYPHLVCLINPICYCFYCEQSKRIHTRAN